MDQVFDVAIIGGGINGCGCAADAAQRGLSVVLFEQDDLASKTSSSSTKLIHGGLRYLENYEFSMVKKALEERQRLLNLAPHIVKPQSLILPYQKHMRPAWFLRLGLFFYDHLSRANHLPKCRSLRRSAKNQYFTPLIDSLNRGFQFYDAATDDARLTIVNAMQAREHAARILTRSKVIQAKAIDSLWQLTIKPQQGKTYTLRAKSLINAAGPWAESIDSMTQAGISKKLTLVKGSHIIVPQMYEGQQAYFLQHEDNRVIFVIPYHGYSMIGTTDVAFNGSLDKIHISKEEVDYLISLVNSYFKKPVSAKDILYSWSGVRPLLADTQQEMRAISRDYDYHFNLSPAPIISLYGGKITTYRQVSEEIINQLQAVFPNLPQSTTKSSPLPGASFGNMNFSQYQQYAKNKYAWLGPDLLNRYLFSYGSCMESFLSKHRNLESMGLHFGASLYQAEVDYLVDQEWAVDADDILKRRTKLILEMGIESQNKLAHYLGTRCVRQSACQV